MPELHVYTQDEFDAFPCEDGYKICPTGNYVRISSFGSCCSFGEHCSFGEGCSHEGLTNSTYFAVDRIGSKRRKTYFFKAEEGFYVRAGCFFGTLDAFRARVREVYVCSPYKYEYLLAAKLAEIVLNNELIRR